MSSAGEGGAVGTHGIKQTGLWMLWTAGGGEHCRIISCAICLSGNRYKDHSSSEASGS